MNGRNAFFVERSGAASRERGMGIGIGIGIGVTGCSKARYESIAIDFR